MTRPVSLQVDLNAMRHNLAQTRIIAPQSQVIAMIKANGYGHGIVEAAKALTSTDAFGVASIDEALIVRQAGSTQPILLMEGVFAADEIAVAAEQRFSIVVHNQQQLEMLKAYQGKTPLNVWLKINTGMHRLGIRPEEFADYYQALNQLEMVAKPIGLMTHFAEADDAQSQSTQEQINLFNQVTKDIAAPRSLANSAGILAWSDAHMDWVRPGLMLYGVSPFADKTGQDFDLMPAMRFCSQVISIVPVKKGARVGYGASWEAKQDGSVGIVAIGYGDGYPQFSSANTPVLVRGQHCYLAGRVSMDMLAIDLSTAPDAKVGDEVELWGPAMPVEIVAKGANTSVYELLTRMTARPQRQVLGD